MPEIEIHPLIAHANLERDVEESLRANELKPKLLYITPRQTELWRQVFLKHSPIHGNPEFARIYRDAFTRISAERRPRKVWLIGLGCGTGLKEAEFATRLMADGHDVSFSALDASDDLVAEASQKLSDAGAKSERHLVCDLTEANFLADWLGREVDGVPRLFTFFGLVPNLAPSLVARLFHALLRPGDILLCSAHLAPVSESMNLPEAMNKVLPQYDNPETRAWLKAGLDEWGVSDRLDEPVMTIGEMEGIPAFLGVAGWKSDELFVLRGEVYSPEVDRPLRVFQSLRYTPELFEEFLRSTGLRAERLAMTTCREEAIWAVRSA